MRPGRAFCSLLSVHSRWDVPDERRTRTLKSFCLVRRPAVANLFSFKQGQRRAWHSVFSNDRRRSITPVIMTGTVHRSLDFAVPRPGPRFQVHQIRKFEQYWKPHFRTYVANHVAREDRTYDDSTSKQSRNSATIRGRPRCHLDPSFESTATPPPHDDYSFLK